MGRNPSVDDATQGTFGTGDSFPVYYTSWYDAVLFCNKRSKQEGYDTVYSYKAACPPSRQCPYVLENLETHYDRFGYRLPTEAEWEYACRAGSVSDFFFGSDLPQSYAWYMDNSGGASHPAGRLLPNGFGLYDMVGNVSEWVGDRLAGYPDSLIVNPTGEPLLQLSQDESSIQHPVRGGAYSLMASYLRSSSRSEPYPMPGYTKSNRVGFRTVLGAFFADTAQTAIAPRDDSLGIGVTCTRSDLISQIGTSRVKIVFVKDNTVTRTLCYLDFTEPSIRIHRIRDSVEVHGPTLSPNGKNVAYGAKAPGLSGPSQMTMRPLCDTQAACFRTPPGAAAYLPSWWVDTATLDTFVVYSTGASMNGDPVWKTEKTLLQKASGYELVGTPKTLCDSGSFHGGMSKSGMYLATGYPRAYFYDIVIHHSMQFFLPPYSGRDDTVQVCNVSITPSLNRPDEMMFLDFGCSRVSTVVGRPYPFHSVVFVCNSAVKLPTHVRGWFAVPKGYDQWDDVKWSNHPDYAVALASSQAKGSASDLVMINLRDSTYTTIASGEGISEPYLWIDPADATEQPDPYRDFGKYDVPMLALNQVYEAGKIRLFWKTRQSVQAGLFGSSPVFYGVDPSAIHSFRSINMATPMGELLLTEILSVKYFMVHCPTFRAAVMSLDPGFLNVDLSWDDPYLNGINDTQGYQFDKRNNYWKDGLPAQVQAKIAAFDASSWPGFDSTGFMTTKVLQSGWGTPIVDRVGYAFSDTFLQKNLRTLRETVDTLGRHNIQVIMVNFPENPLYKTTGSIGRFGPSTDTYGQISQFLRDLEQAAPNFHFYDANRGGDHDYTDAEAMDANHLNYLGAQKMSRRLDSLLMLYVK
jgi:hypothetical protein